VPGALIPWSPTLGNKNGENRKNYNQNCIVVLRSSGTKSGKIGVYTNIKVEIWIRAMEKKTWAWRTRLEVLGEAMTIPDQLSIKKKKHLSDPIDKMESFLLFLRFPPFLPVGEVRPDPSFGQEV
jgi:hypothetical protein